MSINLNFGAKVRTLVRFVYEDLQNRGIVVYITSEKKTSLSSASSIQSIKDIDYRTLVGIKYGNINDGLPDYAMILADFIRERIVGDYTTPSPTQPQQRKGVRNSILLKLSSIPEDVEGPINMDDNKKTFLRVTAKITNVEGIEAAKMASAELIPKKDDLSQLERESRKTAEKPPTEREEVAEEEAAKEEAVEEIDPADIELPESSASVRGVIPARSVGTLTQAAQIINSGNLSLDNIRTLSKIDPTLIGKLKEMKIKEILQDKTGTAEKRRDLADLKALRGFEQQLVVKEKIATPAPRRKADKMTKKVKMAGVAPLTERRKKQRRELRKSLSDF
jgi:hypothetical protein